MVVVGVFGKRGKPGWNKEQAVRGVGKSVVVAKTFFSRQPKPLLLDTITIRMVADWLSTQNLPRTGAKVKLLRGQDKQRKMKQKNVKCWTKPVEAQPKHGHGKGRSICGQIRRPYAATAT